MNEDYKIVNLRDSDQGEMTDCFHNIEKENLKLSQFIMENLRKDSAIGVRDDVLRYISTNASSFGEDQAYLFNIASFINNLKITAEHLAWVNQFFTNIENNHMSIDDFGIVFIAAVEGDIPLEKIKKLFLSEEDEFVIYEKILAYDPNEQEEIKEHIEQTEQIATQIKEDAKRVVIEQRQVEEPGYADVFGSLITALSVKSDGFDTIHIINNNLHKMAAKFQLATSEFTTYSSEIIHEMETDKKEIERLTALMSLQQKMMNSQQNKINNLRNEIVKLNFKIQEAEKTENQRNAINQKISELQNLTFVKSSEQKLLTDNI